LVLVYFLGFYSLPPLSSLRGERARERDNNLIPEISDSGISENDENQMSSSSSTSLNLKDQEPLNHKSDAKSRDIVIHVDEATPLLFPSPRRRRYSFDAHVQEAYTSESALPGLLESTGKNRRKPGALALYNHPSPTLVISIPGESESESDARIRGGGFDYGVSYPEILKTMSITAFGAVEV